MMMNNIWIVAIFLAVLVSVASARSARKNFWKSRAAQTKTQTQCEQVPYHETRTETKKSTQMQSYDCSQTVTTQECHDVPKTVSKACFKTVTRSEKYDCSSKEDEVVCEDFDGKKLRALGTKHIPSNPYAKKGPVQRCHTVSRKMPKTCLRDVPYKESYSCDEIVMVAACEDKDVFTQKTCQKEVEVSVPHEVEVTLYKEVCKQVPAPIPPPVKK